MRDQMEEINKLVESDVKLHPDLARHVEELDMFNAIRHPLVFAVPFFGDKFSIARCNLMYEQKLEMLEKAKKDENWSKYVFLRERPYRLNAFLDIAKKLNHEKFWDLFMDIWSDSENIYQNKLFWRETILMYQPKPAFDLVMNKEDLETFNALPDEFAIYRGTNRSEDEDTDSLSWTIDREKAQWFANRLNHDNPKVLERTIKKEEVLAFYNGRGESEIIVYPK